MGRKKIDRTNKLRQCFELGRPLRDRLEKEAERKNITISALIRNILEHHYEDRNY